jgi:hypothetical protein
MCDDMGVHHDSATSHRFRLSRFSRQVADDSIIEQASRSLPSTG